MYRQKALERSKEALEASRSLKQAIEEGNSFLAEIEAQVLLDEVKSLLKMLEVEKALQMNKYYTRKEAMEQLGIKTFRAFLLLEKKYPDAFVLIDETQPFLYDKETPDKFVAMRQYFQEEKDDRTHNQPGPADNRARE